MFSKHSSFKRRFPDDLSDLGTPVLGTRVPKGWSSPSLVNQTFEPRNGSDADPGLRSCVFLGGARQRPRW